MGLGLCVSFVERLQLHQELRDQNPAQVRQVKVKGKASK